MFSGGNSNPLDILKIFTTWKTESGYNRPFSMYLNSNYKTREIIYSSLNLDAISFVLFPQASEPSLNVNISKMVYFLCDKVCW